MHKLHTHRGSRILGLSLLVALVLPLVSCNNFEKLLKSNDTQRQWRAALDYYGRGKYDKTIQLLEKIAPLSRASARADSAYYYLADCYYRDKNYMLAGYSFEQFTTNYPRSTFYEEALFLAGYCNYLASPRPSLDQELTLKSIALFQQFREQFPKSSHLFEVDKCLKDLYSKLMQKNYDAAKTYYRQELYRSAIVAFKYSLEKYPISPYREEQLFLILKSSYLMAKNSISEKQRERYQQSVDEFLSFISEFPKSQYASEAKQYYRRAMEFLGKSPDPEFLNK